MAKFTVKIPGEKCTLLKISDDIQVNNGDYVIVETEKGQEATIAKLIPNTVAEQFEKRNPKYIRLVRIMTENDKIILDSIKQDEKEAFKICKDLIKQLNLNMDLIKCDYTFDKKRVTFIYTAPERVDFRGLLKELTQVIKKVRIDLRHVSVRDEASMCQGAGICGQPFCCCCYKQQNEPINIKLARDQGMSVAAGKVTGTCGRLLCCLTYEYQNYVEAAKNTCPVGSSVMTQDGIGRVTSVNLLSGKVYVKLQDEKIKDYNQNEIEMLDADVNIDIDIDLSKSNQIKSIDDEDDDIDSLS